LLKKLIDYDIEEDQICKRMGLDGYIIQVRFAFFSAAMDCRGIGPYRPFAKKQGPAACHVNVFTFPVFTPYTLINFNSVKKAIAFFWPFFERSGPIRDKEGIGKRLFISLGSGLHGVLSVGHGDCD
jgi:hypothetical protein